MPRYGMGKPRPALCANPIPTDRKQPHLAISLRVALDVCKSHLLNGRCNEFHSPVLRTPLRSTDVSALTIHIRLVVCHTSSNLANTYVLNAAARSANFMEEKTGAHIDDCPTGCRLNRGEGPRCEVTKLEIVVWCEICDCISNQNSSGMLSPRAAKTTMDDVISQIN